jgi:hypothetical protein
LVTMHFRVRFCNLIISVMTDGFRHLICNLFLGLYILAFLCLLLLFYARFMPSSIFFSALNAKLFSLLSFLGSFFPFCHL